MSELLNWDQRLMTLLNQTWTNKGFDYFMPWITDLFRKDWVVFIVLPIAVLVWCIAQKKRALIVLTQLILALGLSDGITFRILKQSVERERPFVTTPATVLRTTVHYGYSFPSNHAANSFCAAVLLGLHYPFLKPYLLILASLISYSRVYVGVHFPSDVIAGALVGWFVAVTMYYCARKFSQMPLFRGNIR